MDPVTASLLEKNQNLDSKSIDRDFPVLRLASPRAHLHQINLTPNVEIGAHQKTIIDVQIPAQEKENASVAL